VKLALLTCDKLPNCTSCDLELSKILKRHQIVASPAIWNDPKINWNNFDLIIIRSCWDYHLYPKEFTSWLHYIKQIKTPILNSIDTVLWNLNKTYLLELENKGVVIPKTVWVDSTTDQELHDILYHNHLDEVVIKPTIAASAYGAWRTNLKRATVEQERFRQEVEKDKNKVIIQKFLSEVCLEGEWSLIFFNSEFSHAVIKNPKIGDYRVQRGYGGVNTKAAPPKVVLDTAKHILNLCGKDSLYARVDGVLVDGIFVLMELEMIEPCLFLEEDSSALQRFSNAILDRLSVN
jgi:hypothetical protein